MTVADPVFVDTNVLVYAASHATPQSRVARQALDDPVRDGVVLWVSRQVLRESLAVMSRPQTFQNPQPIGGLIADVLAFQQRFQVAEDNPAVTVSLLALLATVPCAGKQVHDANIVATMQVHGIPRLLTHNVADFARFGGSITVLPLIPTP